MSELAALVKRRGIIKSTVTNIKKFVDKVNGELQSGQAVNREQLETRVEKLNEAWVEFHDIENQILLIEGQASEAEEFEEKYFETKSTLKRIFNIRNPSVTIDANKTMGNNTMMNQSFYQHCDVRLPRVSIESFDGNYAKWTSFSDQFTTTIHEHETLSKIHKFQYLKGLLKGDAASLIRHLSMTDANYDQVWDKLQKRYNKKKPIVRDLIELFLGQSSIKQSSHKQLRNMCDISDEVLRGLTALGTSWEGRDPWLIHILVKKLDTETQELWAQHVNDIDCPTVEQLLNFLTDRCDALESCSVAKPSTSFRSDSESKSHSATVGSVKCSMCKNDHLLFQCFRFKKLKIPERRQFLEDNNICINCLRSGHDVNTCSSRKSCFICHKRHHTLIHVKLGESNEKRCKEDNKTRNSETIHNALITDTQISTINIPVSTTNDQISTINIPVSTTNDQISTINIPVSTINNQGSSINKEEYASNLNQSVALFQHSNEPSCSSNFQKRQKTLLSTILVNVSDSIGKTHTIRALLDSGSQSTFISETCVKRIGVNRKHARFAVNGLGSRKAGFTKGAVELGLRSTYNESIHFIVNAFILNQLTSHLPSETIKISHWTKLKNLQLADPLFNTSGEIDMILGNDVFFELILPRQIKIEEGLVAQLTLFGWVLGGKYSQTPKDSSIAGFHTTIASNDDEIEILQQFWELEKLNVGSNRSPEQDYCETHYKKTTTRDVNGRYIVRLPLKDSDGNRNLGKSVNMAVKRQLTMEKRFIKHATLQENYVNFMKEYISLKHMTAVDELASYGNHFYLPHHAVCKESSSTTKLRVVFDGSCKSTSGSSINDVLLVGPTIQKDLMAILLRFRVHEVAISADIEKMYRQVMLHPDDRDLQRIVWRNNTSEPMQHFQLNTVTYGTSCAAFLAVRTLHQLAHDYQTKYAQAASIILADFYVDDMLTGCGNSQQALKIYEDISALLAEGGFHIRKWMSNDHQFLDKIPIKDRESSVVEFESDRIIKTLGICWNPYEDTFCFRVNLPSTEKITKRILLSQAASIFDPMGWLAPLTVSIKILFQSLWLKGLAWDDELPTSIIGKWNKIKSSMKKIETIKIPRHLETSNGTNFELHAFSDASEAAYGAVAYIKTIQEDGTAHIRLLAAKTKVAPIKQVSLPRLELCAALLLCRLVTYITKHLGINTTAIFAYTDSSIVLAWLDDHPRRWKNFIANRTSEILEHIPKKHWHHISSKQNPADLASRGLSPNDLVTNDLWWNGPKFLSTTNNANTLNLMPIDFRQTKLEERNSYKIFHVEMPSMSLVSDLFERFSSLAKIYRIIAYICRFITNARRGLICSTADFSKPIAEHVPLPDIHEINRAEIICIKWAQAEAFTEELSSFTSKREISKRSVLLPLTPILDDMGILRVGGRIERSTCSFDTKHPIILPKDNKLSELIIGDVHKQNLHAGPTLLTNLIRQRFWNIGCRSMTRHHVTKCIVCFKHKRLHNEQLMGNLPSARVNSGRPFQYTGVDYAGPIYLRERSGRGRCKITKGYIALFICMSVKAVHIELVSDMTTEAFIAALKRFVSRRGVPVQIHSDNGSNFVGCRRELNELFAMFKNESHFNLITNFLTQQKIHFVFNPAQAPHFGGLWEANIKSTKYHLQRVAGQSHLTFEEMSTLLCQIEAVLNSRPLCRLSEDVSSYDALTPGHFLVGEAIKAIPEPDLTHLNTSRLSKWQNIQSRVQGFWKSWHRDYLTSLNQRSKWKSKTKNLELNQLVLIKDENVPQSCWLMGRIAQLHHGTDGLIRVATIKTSKGEIKRSIVKLIPLPIDEN